MSLRIDEEGNVSVKLKKKKIKQECIPFHVRCSTHSFEIIFRFLLILFSAPGNAIRNKRDYPLLFAIA